MFFELHSENRIGFKELTNPDLGRQKSSHQTHIGLFDDVLTFLPNNIEIDDSMVIYDGNIELMSLNFDRIENPDHTFRSPKIRAGGRNVISVVTFVRDKVKDFSNDTKWYLFWFALKSEQIVFFLFNNKSTTYTEIVDLGIALPNNIKNRLTDNDGSFYPLLRYLENLVNQTGAELVQELEIVAQTREMASLKKYREYDIKKARELFIRIGKEGELLINEYFDEQKRKGQISNYCWVNKEKESGLPYDFYYETLSGEIVYLDVKTTNYKFAQKMIFSNQEINFATEIPNKYYIYRVYIDDDNEHCLKVCNNAKPLFGQIKVVTSNFESELISLATVENIKMAISPTQQLIKFSNQIKLG